MPMTTSMMKIALMRKQNMSMAKTAITITNTKTKTMTLKETEDKKNSKRPCPKWD
jgi:hypothetical protein